MRAFEGGVNCFFRAEYIAEVNKDLCKGCRTCVKQCQFGAMYFDPTNRKVLIEADRCFGCGICRATCVHNAIHLKPRQTRFEAVA